MTGILLYHFVYTLFFLTLFAMSFQPDMSHKRHFSFQAQEVNMDYLSVEAYAKSQGIHPRTVQRRCQAGLIPGARKLGNNWLIPKEADSGTSDPHVPEKNIPATTYLTFASGQADDHLEGLPKNASYRLAQGLFAYYRCEYEKALEAFDQMAPTDEDYLVGKLFSLYAAISLGDFERYRQIRPLFDASRTKALQGTGMEQIMECFQSNINVSILVLHNLPDWLKKGDLAPLPLSMGDLAWYTYIKYLQVTKDYRVMLVAAEARLSMQNPDTYSLSDIYAYIYAALGHLKEDNLALARKRMIKIMHLALPDRFIGPFVETLTTMQGLTERCLMEAFPQHYDRVIGQWKKVFPQWVRAHNELSAYIISEVLTLREHQIALYAVDGLTNRQIAEKLYLSLSTVKKDLSSIFDKLGISCRRQLKDLF